MPLERRVSVIARSLGILASLDWLFLMLILPVVSFPEASRSPVLLVIPVLWGLRKATYGHFVPPTPVDWPVFGLLFMVLISIFITVDMAFSFPKIAGMVYGIAVYYAAVTAVQDSWRRLLPGLGVLLMMGWGVAILGLAAGRWQVKLPVLGTVIDRLPQRMLSLPGIEQGVNTNEIGGVLLWVAPLALVLTFIGLKERAKLKRQLPGWQGNAALSLLIVTSLFLGGVLLLTQSRGSLLGFGTALLFALITFAGRRQRWVLALVTLLALLGTMMAVGGVEAVTDLVFGAEDQAVDTDIMNSVEGRLEIWSRALYGIEDFPLTGVGMNMFRRVVHILYPLFLVTPGQDIAHAHNQFLQAALDLGIPGLVAYVALWLGAAGMLRQIWLSAADVWARALAIAFSSSLLAYFVYGLTDTVALGARPGFIFWLLLGLIAGLHRRVAG